MVLRDRAGSSSSPQRWDMGCWWWGESGGCRGQRHNQHGWGCRGRAPATVAPFPQQRVHIYIEQHSRARAGSWARVGGGAAGGVWCVQVRLGIRLSQHNHTGAASRGPGALTWTVPGAPWARGGEPGQWLPVGELLEGGQQQVAGADKGDSHLTDTRGRNASPLTAPAPLPARVPRHTQSLLQAGQPRGQTHAATPSNGRMARPWGLHTHPASPAASFVWVFSVESGLCLPLCSVKVQRCGVGSWGPLPAPVDSSLRHGDHP